MKKQEVKRLDTRENVDITTCRETNLNNDYLIDFIQVVVWRVTVRINLNLTIIVISLNFNSTW